MSFKRNLEFYLDGSDSDTTFMDMKSSLALIVVLVLVAGFVGTLAVMYFASSSTEIESTR